MGLNMYNTIIIGAGIAGSVMARKLAEEGGYSMILSLQESNSILWYSHTVDITEDVISRLGL